MAKKNIKVKAHSRKHPTKNKRVEVDSYSRNQRYRQYKNLTKGSRIPELKCFYCGDTVSIGEAIQSDNEFARMEGEDREFLLDSLPKSNNPRKAPFVHKSDFGFDVLNICSKHISQKFNDSDLDTYFDRISKQEAIDSFKKKEKQVFGIDDDGHEALIYDLSDLENFNRFAYEKNEDVEVNRLIAEKESTYKKLKWVDNKIALKERQIRKLGNTKPLKVESLEEDIRELTEDQEVLGEDLDEIEHEIESKTNKEYMEW